jgi:hypothetical protein
MTSRATCVIARWSATRRGRCSYSHATPCARSTPTHHLMGEKLLRGKMENRCFRPASTTPAPTIRCLITRSDVKPE